MRASLTNKSVKLLSLYMKKLNLLGESELNQIKIKKYLLYENIIRKYNIHFCD